MGNKSFSLLKYELMYLNDYTYLNTFLMEKVYSLMPSFCEVCCCVALSLGLESESDMSNNWNVYNLF